MAYNVYHRFRYDKPDYPFYQRIKPYLYRENGKLWGYGLKVFPDKKPWQMNSDRAGFLKEGGGISTTHRRGSKPGTCLLY